MGRLSCNAFRGLIMTTSPVTIVSNSTQLLAAVKADTKGGTIELAAGTYAPFTLYGTNPSAAINITSETSKASAVLTGFTINDSSNITFSNLTMSTASTP